MSSSAAFDFADVLRRRAPLIVGGALIVAVAVAAYAFTRPRQWEASVTLLASASKLGEGANPPVAAANYLPILQNPAIATEVIKEFHLADAPRSWTTPSFLADVLRSNTVGGTGLLELRVRLDNADLAARVANAVADRAVVQSRQLSQDEAGSARDQLEGQLGDARGRYEAALTAYETFRRGANLEAVRKDVDAMLEQRSHVLNFSSDAVQARARLDAARSELAKRQPLREVTRSIDGDPALLEAARPSAGGRVLDLKLKDQLLNDAYSKIDETVATATADLAGYEQRLAQAQRETGPAGEAKLKKLYELEKTNAQLETDVKVAERAYQDAASQYENARLQVSSRAGQLQILSRAIAPESPLSRRAVINSVLAFVLAAAVLSLLAVAAGYLADARAV